MSLAKVIRPPATAPAAAGPSGSPPSIDDLRARLEGMWAPSGSGSASSSCGSMPSSASPAGAHQRTGSDCGSPGGRRVRFADSVVELGARPASVPSLPALERNGSGSSSTSSSSALAAGNAASAPAPLRGSGMLAASLRAAAAAATHDAAGDDSAAADDASEKVDQLRDRLEGLWANFEAKQAQHASAAAAGLSTSLPPALDPPRHRLPAAVASSGLYATAALPRAPRAAVASAARSALLRGASGPPALVLPL